MTTICPGCLCVSSNEKCPLCDRSCYKLFGITSNSSDTVALAAVLKMVRDNGRITSSGMALIASSTREDVLAAKKLIDQLDEITEKGTVLVCLNCMYVRSDNLDDALCEKCHSLMGEVMPENIGKRVLVKVDDKYPENNLRGLFSQDYVLSFVRL